MLIRTVGHGTLAADAFVAVLRGAGIERLVDVRRFPGSRRYPHFGTDQMGSWLPEASIDYRWLDSLGGRRKPQPDSPNVGLRNDQFRAYADHMATEGFACGVAELVALARERPSAVMCAESVWWRCHRRMISDHLVMVEGVDVEHLFHDGRTARHEPTAEARRAGDHIVYDAGTLFADAGG